MLGRKLGHVPGPQDAACPQLGHFGQQVHSNAPEEAQPRRKLIHIKPRLDPSPHIGQTIGDGIGQLLFGGGPSLLHVVSRNADGIELGHVLRGVSEDVADDAHARRRRINKGVAHHELLQNVILNGARKLLRRNPLFLGGCDVKGHDGQDGPIHGHGHRHFVEGDFLEQPLHVFYAVDGHTGFSYIA